jgi:hypothetical protein
MVTIVGKDVDEQAPLETATVYEPPIVLVIDCVIAPLDQILPIADEELKITESP